jgi:predicted kinase
VTVIVVSGIPGSGKTTLAKQLAPVLGVPLVSKDVIQEALMDALGSGDMAWAMQLSRAAHVVMYNLVTDLGPDVVLEANFHRGLAEPELHALGCPLVQVFCRCPVELAWSRYQQRRTDPARHAGHRPEHQDEAATRHWREAPPAPLALDAPLVDVDTSQHVDTDDLANRVRALAPPLRR